MQNLEHVIFWRIGATSSKAVYSPLSDGVCVRNNFAVTTNTVITFGQFTIKSSIPILLRTNGNGLPIWRSERKVSRSC